MGGNSHFAIHLLERFLVELVASKLPDPTSLMTVHAGLVLPYFDVGMRDRAAVHAEGALKFVSEAEDPFAIAGMHVQVARVLLSNGKVKEAETSLTRAEDLYRSIDLKTELAMARLAHGYALGHAGKLRDAEVLLRSALETFEEVGRVLERARATNELARVYRLQDRGSEVEPLLERSLELLEGSDPGELALTHRELALCAGSGNPKRAEKGLRQAIELFELGEDKVQLAATYGLLGDLMRVTGRSDAECESYKAGVRQFVETGDSF
jgi:tetratricopeptide (TPR) repeat protein